MYNIQATLMRTHSAVTDENLPYVINALNGNIKVDQGNTQFTNTKVDKCKTKIDTSRHMQLMFNEKYL